MDDALALVGEQGARLLDGWGSRTVKSDGVGDVLDDLFQAYPFTVDVECLGVFVEWVGGDGDDVQAAVQGCRGNALFDREATQEMTFKDEETIGAVGVFPG